MRTEEHQALPIGTRIENFEIERVLGTGGFGITYEAYDDSLDRKVAIKEYFPQGYAHRDQDQTTLRPHTTGEDGTYAYGLKRFLGEARILAKFRDPAIVRVHRFMEANGTAYLVMDYEEGRTLDKLMRKGLSLGEGPTRDIVIPVLEGLKLIHSNNYLHRDIKPSNILMRQSGEPVLLDFGAARRALEDRAGGLTVMLTPGYAPFEQYSSEEPQGPWSDLYAVGATAYHCLIGSAPVAATDRMGALCKGDRDPLHDGLDKIAAECSPLFAKAIAWLLETHAGKRPQKADEVLNVIASKTTLSRDGQTQRFDTETVLSPNIRKKKTRHGQPPSNRQATTPGREPRRNTAPSRKGVQTARHATVAPTARLTPDMIATAEQNLTEHLGPIARVLVKNAVRSTVDRDEFYRLLAEELPDAATRQSFIRSLK